MKKRAIFKSEIQDLQTTITFFKQSLLDANATMVSRNQDTNTITYDIRNIETTKYCMIKIGYFKTKADFNNYVETNPVAPSVIGFIKEINNFKTTVNKYGKQYLKQDFFIFALHDLFNVHDLICMFEKKGVKHG